MAIHITDVAENPTMTRNYTGEVESTGTKYHFLKYDIEMELVKLCEYDYDYCYQGAVGKVNNKLYHVEFWGPLGNHTKLQPKGYERLILRLDQPIEMHDNCYYIIGERMPLAGLLD